MIFTDKQSCAKQYGLTMIEMTLVVMVIATIVLFAVQRSQRYTISANTETVRGSVKFLFDLMERYYYSQCHDLYPANSGQGPTLTEADFVAAGLLSSDAFAAGVRDPFGGGISSYRTNIKYVEVVNPNYDLSDPRYANYWKARGYWSATVTFKFPDNLPQQTFNLYAGQLMPTSVSGYTLTWVQTISTETQRAGAPLSPLGESLKRFSIQQFVPTSSDNSIGSEGYQRAYSQDYNSTYAPAAAEQSASCEALLEMEIAGKEFQLRRELQ